MGRRRLSFTFRVVGIIGIVLPVCGQVGVTICACQPSVYTFTFNFSATCDISTVEGAGVRDADCFARGFALGSEDDVNDTIPVQVTTVSIMELNQNLGVVTQTPYTDVFRDGDSFTYTSILSTPGNISGLMPDMIPGGLQLGIVGVNQLEEPITNVWIILFDNACGIFPVLEVGDQIGWTILTDLQNPLQSVCPLAPPPLLPTQSPTAISSAPTVIPASPSPTRIPISSTLEQPSIAPTTILSAVPSPSCPPVRTNFRNDTSTMGLEPVSSLPKQKYMKKHNIHNFYDPLQYDARGRKVGTNSPVVPPSECLIIGTIIPVNQDHSPGSSTLKKKKVPSKLEKKEKLARPKDDGNAEKDSHLNRNGGDDDDISFVELERPSAIPIQAPVLLDETKGDSSFGSDTQSQAPTTTYDRLGFGSVTKSQAPTTTYDGFETKFKMIREDTKTKTKENSSGTKEKMKKGRRFGR